MDKQNYFHSVRILLDKCNGCTHCIRACETEAIRVRNGKAIIHEVRCIDCGECIRICPREAITTTSDSLDALKRFDYNIALPSTSFAAQSPTTESLNKLLNGFLYLGFDDVFETARANQIVAQSINLRLQEKGIVKPYISSVCPAIVRLIQVRFPSLVENIIPVEAPLEIAGKIIKKRKALELGIDPCKIGVFYISPCPARVTSIKQPVGTIETCVDGAIALREIFNRLLLNIDKIEIKKELAHATPAELRWGAVGGEVRLLNTLKTISVDGISNVVHVLNKMENYDLEDFDFVEAFACPCGCVGGVLNFENPYVAKQRVYLNGRKGEDRQDTEMIELGRNMYENGEILLTHQVEPRPVLNLDSDMRKAIQKLEKLEGILLNLPGIDCGACGSPTCRALAEDIVQGYASITDCVFTSSNKE